ncbi:hypothetical protein LZ30DRAFT_802682 [Colletotrichum cereale]|nr:hypothetical protein LZ30DRAFT_802682 [Colletotrichum cereale]
MLRDPLPWVLEIYLVDDKDLVMITARAVLSAGRLLLCRKDDGSICLCNAETGLQLCVLYDHGSGAAITHLECDVKSGLIASADDSSTVLVYKMSDEKAPEVRIRFIVSNTMVR